MPDIKDERLLKTVSVDNKRQEPVGIPLGTGLCDRVIESLIVVLQVLLEPLFAAFNERIRLGASKGKTL